MFVSTMDEIDLTIRKMNHQEKVITYINMEKSRQDCFAKLDYLLKKIYQKTLLMLSIFSHIIMKLV